MSSPYLIASICSPLDAGKMSGRYVETTFDANGKPQPVIRSLRLLALEDPGKELVIRGSITPKAKKTAPSPSVADVDDLCNLFKSKASVTPKKKTSSAKKVAADMDTKPSSEKPSAKAVVKTTPKRNARRSLRFSVSGNRRSLGGVA